MKTIEDLLKAIETKIVYKQNDITSAERKQKEIELELKGLRGELEGLRFARDEIKKK